MNEHEFLLKLEDRAKEQELLMKKTLLPTALFSVSLWLGRHPWRFLIPLALLLTFIFRMTFGKQYTELILWIFGYV